MNSIELLNLLDTLAIYRRNLILSFDTSSFCLPINITQERVLMTIFKVSNINMKELSALIGLEKSSITRVIDSLIEKGLVTRSYGTQDRRKLNCTLTELGLKQAGELEKQMMMHIENHLKNLSQDDKDALINNLTCAVKILSKYL
jgi:DNA-binding MarR family transcriptional regulator